MRIVRRAGNRHVTKVLAEIGPHLRHGEEYRYRAQCCWIHAATGERIAAVYGYLTSERFLLVEDTTRGPISGHDLDALLDIDRDDQRVVLSFVIDDESTQAASVGLQFTPLRLADDFLDRLLLEYQRWTGKAFEPRT